MPVYIIYMMRVRWYVVVSGACLPLSGGVWSISGGVNVYILPMRVADPLMLLMRYAADELMLLMR